MRRIFSILTLVFLLSICQRNEVVDFHFYSVQTRRKTHRREKEERANDDAARSRRQRRRNRMTSNNESNQCINELFIDCKKYCQLKFSHLERTVTQRQRVNLQRSKSLAYLASICYVSFQRSKSLWKNLFFYEIRLKNSCRSRSHRKMELLKLFSRNIDRTLRSFSCEKCFVCLMHNVNQTTFRKYKTIFLYDIFIVVSIC